MSFCAEAASVESVRLEWLWMEKGEEVKLDDEYKKCFLWDKRTCTKDAKYYSTSKGGLIVPET